MSVIDFYDTDDWRVEVVKPEDGFEEDFLSRGVNVLCDSFGGFPADGDFQEVRFGEGEVEGVVCRVERLVVCGSGGVSVRVAEEISEREIQPAYECSFSVTVEDEEGEVAVCSSKVLSAYGEDVGAMRRVARENVVGALSDLGIEI